MLYEVITCINPLDEQFSAVIKVHGIKGVANRQPGAVKDLATVGGGDTDHIAFSILPFRFDLPQQA